MFFVFEIQRRADGSNHVLNPHVYDEADNVTNQNYAWNKYYSILAEAAIAKIPRNGAMICDEFMNVLDKKLIQHGEWEGYIEPDGGED